MDPNYDIVPTLRMLDGLVMNKAADEIERLRAALSQAADDEREKCARQLEDLGCDHCAAALRHRRKNGIPAPRAEGGE